MPPALLPDWQILSEFVKPAMPSQQTQNVLRTSQNVSLWFCLGFKRSERFDNVFQTFHFISDFFVVVERSENVF